MQTPSLCEAIGRLDDFVLWVLESRLLAPSVEPSDLVSMLSPYVEARLKCWPTSSWRSGNKCESQ
ncbi:hypothetical protein K0651_05665 [Ornithinimicrobium sp. Arc0846-15]|nr:hypothetical protein [Ornithinimicrobium laminariae]